MSEHLKTIGIGKQYKSFMRPCEITGSTNFELFQERGRIGEPGVYGAMPVYICKDSGFKMLNPRYEDQFYKDYYQELYRAVAFGQTKPSDAYLYEQRVRGAGVLNYVSKFVKPGRLLDLGCASGATMLSWIEAGWKCTGVDPHKPSVDLATKELKLDVHVGAGEDLPFDDNSFDFFLCLGPHEHAYDLNKMFEETRRCLVDGGHILIRWRSNEIFGSPLEYYNHNHYRFFTPNTWKLALRKHGFSIVATTDERLEGWQSWSYVLAKKDLEPSQAAVNELIASGVKDDWQAEIKKIQDLRKDFYERCKAFLDLVAREKGDEEKIHAAVQRGEVRWKFMTEIVAWKVKRAVMEAERYAAEYEAGRVK